jgi:hypothetical protein
MGKLPEWLHKGQHRVPGEVLQIGSHTRNSASYLHSSNDKVESLLHWLISTRFFREEHWAIDLMNMFAYSILNKLDRWKVAYREAELYDEEAYG